MSIPVLQTDQHPVRRLVAPFLRFVRLESSSSIVLLVGATAAVVLANSPLAPAYFALLRFPAGGTDDLAFHFTVREWINDGLMTVFFLIVALEVKRELLVGELTSLRRALLPVVAALGGVLAPALFYLVLNQGRSGSRGWGVPIATDIAFSLAVLSLFGRRIPIGLKVFLVTLAIVDDIAGVAVIATAYTHQLRFRDLAIATLLFGACLLLNRLGVKRLSIYMVIGILLWRAVLLSGVHATLAGVLLAMSIPSRSFPTSETGDRGELSDSPLERLQTSLHPWVSFGIMPLFAFANAGIPLHSISGGALQDPVFFGILFGLLLGKPIGITLFSWIAVRSRLAELPHGVTWRQLHAASWLGGIGFTISIFIAGLAFTTEQEYTLARIAVLSASACAAVVGTGLVAITSRPQTV